MKALSIILWNAIGPFHTYMNYIGMLTGHKMRGPGHTEILLQRQLVTSGINQRCSEHTPNPYFASKLCTAMERLLMEQLRRRASPLPAAHPFAIWPCSHGTFPTRTQAVRVRLPVFTHVQSFPSFRFLATTSRCDRKRS